MIGDKIKELINNLEGGNKAQFARKIGIPNGSSGLVHDWISGRTSPKLGYQNRICHAYGVSVQWLNDGDAETPLYRTIPAMVGYDGDLNMRINVLEETQEFLKGQVEDLKKDKAMLQSIISSLQETNHVQQKIIDNQVETLKKLTTETTQKNNTFNLNNAKEVMI
jgi:transcriptional regulator with XRE-family HTH domain